MKNTLIVILLISLSTDSIAQTYEITFKIRFILENWDGKKILSCQFEQTILEFPFEPQLGDTISIGNFNLGKVKDRRIRVRPDHETKSDPPFTMTIHLESDTYTISGETLNDIPLEEVYECWKEHWGYMYKSGFTPQLTKSVQELWDGWIEEFERSGLIK